MGSVTCLFLDISYSQVTKKSRSFFFPFGDACTLCFPPLASGILSRSLFSLPFCM